MNTFDWLSALEIPDPSAFDIVEVSFKNGARKDFFRNHKYANAITGDMVVVETGSGADVGKVSLSGELVRLQLKKKKLSEERVIQKVLRIANQRDLEKLQEARELEHKAMVRARAISRSIGLEMKIGDVEFQGDKRKATFYYTAEGRVDFRELVRLYAKEFKVKIEMRQIGSRQESARVGGIGSCGRELCCSTWLSDFRTVTTSAARYQNISINQSKLSGQCGRLKCCLNYELDTYLDALESFPKKVDQLKTKAGTANLIKTDIFKGLMYYAYQKERGRGPVIVLTKERVHEVKDMNLRDELPMQLIEQAELEALEAEKKMDFADVTGIIELPDQKKKKRRKSRRRGDQRRSQPKNQQANKKNPSARNKRGNNFNKNASKNTNKNTNKKNP
jgi:cell fate regulator YaaT (PSP1 superfamily)